MLVLELIIGLGTLIGGLLLNKEIQKLKKQNKEQEEHLQSLQSVVDAELDRVEQAMDDLFLKREEDLRKFDNMSLADKAKHARIKFNKKK